MFAPPKHNQSATSEGGARQTAGPARRHGASEPNHLWQSIALSPLTVQTKLSVSQPSDAHELEADRVADRVMRMPAPEAREQVLSITSQPPPDAPRRCDGCAQEDEEKKLLRKEQRATGDVGALAPAEVSQASTSPGQPLDPGARAFVEPRFGVDFGHVRVHTNPSAATAAQAIMADAYTVGSDMYFAAGKYRPLAHDGLALIAHEATHVLQQTGERSLVKSRTRREDRASGGRERENRESESSRHDIESVPPVPVVAQTATLGVRQRRITVDVLNTQLPAAAAHQLTDAELESQINLVRGHLSALSPGSTEYLALQENLMVLEAEMGRRGSHGGAPVGRGQTVPPAPRGSSAVPAALAAGTIGSLAVWQPTTPAPTQPLPGEIPQSAFRWSRIPGETPFNPAGAAAETAGATGQTTAAVGQTAGGLETTAAASGLETTAAAGGLETTAVAGGLETTAAAGSLGTTAAAGGLETTAVVGGLETAAVVGETAELAVAGTVLATEAAIPVIGWIALGVTVVAVGGYLGYRYLLSEERRPARRLTSEENQRVMPADHGHPAQMPGPEGQNITPAIDPVTGQMLYTPAHQYQEPGIDPTSGERLYTPGAPSSERAEASSRRGPRRGRQQSPPDENYTDPRTGEPVTPRQPNTPTPTYNPVTGLFEDPVTGVTKQTFRTAEEALEHFQRFARPGEGTLRIDWGAAQSIRESGPEWRFSRLHIPVRGEGNQYRGTIYQNSFQGHDFYTWSRGDH